MVVGELEQVRSDRERWDSRGDFRKRDRAGEEFSSLI